MGSENKTSPGRGRGGVGPAMIAQRLAARVSSSVMKASLRLSILALWLTTILAAQQLPKPVEADFTLHNYRFKSGEVLPDLNLHYATYGKPPTVSSGRVTSAVLILHGTTGSGQQFTAEHFSALLFGPEQLLDVSRYFIVLPDNVGHGHSAKPSDGLHAKFPHYDYDDMVDLQHLLLTQALKVNHLRLLMGTSMGCMHSWIWAETYPDFMDAVMPLACLPVQIAGRNRMMRKMVMDSIRTDPEWINGDYKQQPRGLRTAFDILQIMGSSPLQMQKEYPTRDKADAYVDNFLKARMAATDANDVLYAFDASRDYDPSPKLDEIKVPVMFVNSADDMINPPELGIAEREIKKVKRGRFV